MQSISVRHGSLQRARHNLIHHCKDIKMHGLSQERLTFLLMAMRSDALFAPQRPGYLRTALNHVDESVLQ
jgi:hypothetical protein